MANIGTELKNWSTTEASNQPDSTDATTLVGDLRAIQSGVRYIYSQDTIASATTCDLGSKTAGSLTISGTTTITGLGTVSAGIRKSCVFSGILTLTHNGTSLILPSAANITTAANDRAEFESLGSGNWRCNWYERANGAALVGVQDGEVTTAKLAAGVANGLTTVTLDVDADYAVIADASDSGNVKKGLIPAASLTAKGAVELSTAAEYQAGTDAARVPSVQVLRENLWIYLAEQATTSGTAINFTGIPAWATEVELFLVLVSTNGTSTYVVQIRDSGGLEATGYTGNAVRFNTGANVINVNSTYFNLMGGNATAANLVSGVVRLELENATSNTWNLVGSLTEGTSADQAQISIGSKALSAALDGLTLTTAGGVNTFDAGVARVRYR